MDAEPDDAAIDAEGDALDHLWGAAHEMLRAMRMLIDAADEFVESQRAETRAAEPRVDPGQARNSGPRRSSEQRGGRVHHIDIEAS